MNILTRRLIGCNRIIFRNMSVNLAEAQGVEISKVLNALEKFAPKALSESWDNTGLLVEPYTPKAITTILLTNDLTEDVVLEGLSQGTDMIISYHPPIFAPMKSVLQRSWKESLVSLLLEKRIYLYSPHTSWDCVKGGVNDWLGSAFSIKSSVPIKPSDVNSDFGAGRLLQLDSKISITDAVNKVKQLTKVSHVRVALGKNRDQTQNDIETIALCAGSGASVLKGVIADLYLTGEMLHHDVLDAAQNNTSVILTNHSDSERGFLKSFKKYLEAEFQDQVQVFVSQNDRDPLITL